MLSNTIASRSLLAQCVGIGLLMKVLYALRRNSRTQSGSSLMSEMKWIVFSVRPTPASCVCVSGYAKFPMFRSISKGDASLTIRASQLCQRRLGDFVLHRFIAFVAFFFQLEREFFSAAPHDPSLDH